MSQLDFGFPEQALAAPKPRPTRVERMTAYLNRPRLLPEPLNFFDVLRMVCEQHAAKQREQAYLASIEADSEVR